MVEAEYIQHQAHASDQHRARMAAKPDSMATQTLADDASVLQRKDRLADLPGMASQVTHNSALILNAVRGYYCSPHPPAVMDWRWCTNGYDHIQGVPAVLVRQTLMSGSLGLDQSLSR
jgi:hypothetical protein